MESTCAGASHTEELAGSLARFAESPRRTRHLHSLFGPYCHQFRNVLNSIKLSLYLARRGGRPETDGVWLDLSPRYEAVERFIDRFQQLSRPMRIDRITLPLDLLVEDRKAGWGRVLAEQGRRLILEPSGGSSPGAFDPMRLGQAFDDLVAWRARAGDPSTDLRLWWTTEDGWFHVDWDEPSSTATAVDRMSGGAIGSDPDQFDPLAALTVPILTRIMTLHGGALEATGTERWRLSLRWPLDATSPVARPHDVDHHAHGRDENGEEARPVRPAGGRP